MDYTHPADVLKFSRPLWKHQSDVINRFANKSEAALFHEMGTGKTTSAIGWMRWKYREAQVVLPTLILSPIATLENWREEIVRNAPLHVSTEVVILHGKESKRIKDIEKGKIVITNPESLDMNDLHAMLVLNGFDIVIVDESHRFKNHQAKRFKRLISISDFAKHRMIMTGTPILNSYLDLWSQFRILDKGQSFTENFYLFREKYFRDQNAGWKGKPKYFPCYVPKPDIEADITSTIDKISSRVKKSECLTLPPLVRMTEYVEMSKEQAKLYNELRDDLVSYVKSDACVATNALTQVLRLLQIVSGYAQTDSQATSGKHRIKENPRLDRLRELLEDVGSYHKVIVWCSFSDNYAAIRELCDELKMGYAELTGETKERFQEINKFKLDPKCRVMISNPQAGGVGVNLAESSYSIYYSRSFSLGDRLQSEARNYRGGSEVHESVTLIDLVCKGTIDEDVLAALSRKEDFSNNILERLKAL